MKSESSTSINIKIKSDINLNRIAMDQVDLARVIEEYTKGVAIIINKHKSSLSDNFSKDHFSTQLEENTIVQLLNNHNLFGLNSRELDSLHIYFVN